VLYRIRLNCTRTQVTDVPVATGRNFDVPITRRLLACFGLRCATLREVRVPKCDLGTHALTMKGFGAEMSMVERFVAGVVALGYMFADSGRQALEVSKGNIVVCCPV